MIYAALHLNMIYAISLRLLQSEGDFLVTASQIMKNLTVKKYILVFCMIGILFGYQWKNAENDSTTLHSCKQYHVSKKNVSNFQFVTDLW